MGPLELEDNCVRKIGKGQIIKKKTDINHFLGRGFKSIKGVCFLN